MKRKSALPIPATEQEKAALDVSVHDAQKALEQDAAQREADGNQRINAICSELRLTLVPIYVFTPAGQEHYVKVVAQK